MSSQKETTMTEMSDVELLTRDPEWQKQRDREFAEAQIKWAQQARTQAHILDLRIETLKQHAEILRRSAVGAEELAKSFLDVSPLADPR